MSYRGQTDRRLLDWHYGLPADWHAIDLDLVEVCARCRDSLLLVEQTRDPAKATSILRRLAERAGIPALLVLVPDDDGRGRLDDDDPVRWRKVYPAGAWQDGTLADLRDGIGRLREAHQTKHRGGNGR